MSQPMPANKQKITGNVRVEDRAKGRVWIAAYMRADGSKTRKTLGMAWVKDSGRRTPRGAVVWRVADGPKPDDTYLTPREASEALDALIVAERVKPSGVVRSTGKTFGEAADGWLDYVERIRGIAPTTLESYRGMVRLLQAEGWPATLPLRRITTDRIEHYQDGLLAEGRLGRDSVRRRMIVLRGILARARRVGWIAVNPAADVTVVAQSRPNPDFNVLTSAQVESVAAAAGDVAEAEMPRMRDNNVDLRGLAVMRERRALYGEAVRLAAYTGLRLGELRALRWSDIDRAGRNIRVNRNAPTSAPACDQIRAPKAGMGRSVPMTDQAQAVIDRLAASGRPVGADALVLPTRAGGMIQAKRLRDAFYRGLASAGLGHLRLKGNPMTFHDLRHTFGTLAVRKLPLSDVQAYMGHADVQTTMRYVHHVPRNDAAEQLSQAFAVGADETASTRAQSVEIAV